MDIGFNFHAESPAQPDPCIYPGTDLPVRLHPFWGHVIHLYYPVLTQIIIYTFYFGLKQDGKSRAKSHSDSEFIMPDEIIPQGDRYLQVDIAFLKVRIIHL